MCITRLNIKEHKISFFTLFAISFILILPHIQQYEYFQYSDSYRWMLYDDSAWGELSPTLSLLEKGEFIWGYLYHEVIQISLALFVTPLIMLPLIHFFGIYPGILIIHILFLFMGSLVPVFIYGTVYKVFDNKKAAFISGLFIATESFFIENAVYISRHPPSIFFFALSIFLVTIFIFRPPDKRSIMLSLLTGFSLGFSTISDGDGIGIVMVFILSVIFLQIKKQELSFSFNIDAKLTSHAVLIVIIAVSIYSIPIIRNYRNIGIAAPNWISSYHLAASNNNKIVEVASKGMSLFFQDGNVVEFCKNDYRTDIERKLAINIQPEYEFYKAYLNCFKGWVKKHPVDFIVIFVKRFFQNITIYYSWHSTAIALSALISIFFLKPYISRSYHLIMIWFISGFMFSLIYLTFWHQMHQVMVLSVFSGFGIVRFSGFLNAKAEGVPFLKKAPKNKFIFLFLTIIALIVISYIIKVRIMKDPMTRHETGRFRMYKLPVMADGAFKNDYKDVKKELPEGALLITQRNPFLVNRVTQSDTLLTKLGYRFDPYGPENLQNGWLITTPKGWIYRFRENADYMPKAADYTYDAIKSGRTVVSDFDPNIDKLRFSYKEFFSGKKVKFYRLDALDKVTHIDNKWREEYNTSNLLSHPNVIEIKGAVNTTNPDYIFSIIDNTEASVTFMFKADMGHFIENANLYISTNCSYEVDRFIQLSADGKKWTDLPVKANEWHMNKAVLLSGVTFQDKVYIRFFQDRLSNMHVKSFEIGMNYKNN